MSKNYTSDTAYSISDSWSIVVIKNENGRPRVVDGQQRLATAMILLAAIRDYFYRHNQKDRAGDIERDYLMKRSLRTEDRQPKFILSNADRDYFQKRILERPDHPDRIPLEKQKLSEIRKPSHKNLNIAALEVARRVRAIAASPGDTDSRLVDWVEFIRDSARIIWVACTK